MFKHLSLTFSILVLFALGIAAVAGGEGAVSNALLGDDRVLGIADFAKAKAKALTLSDRLSAICAEMSALVLAKQAPEAAINRQIGEPGKTKTKTEAGLALDVSRTKLEASGESFSGMLAANDRVIRVSFLALGSCAILGVLTAAVYSRKKISGRLSLLVVQKPDCAKHAVEASGRVTARGATRADATCESAASLVGSNLRVVGWIRGKLRTFTRRRFGGSAELQLGLCGFSLRCTEPSWSSALPLVRHFECYCLPRRNPNPGRQYDPPLSF